MISLLVDLKPTKVATKMVLNSSTNCRQILREHMTVLPDSLIVIYAGSIIADMVDAAQKLLRRRCLICPFEENWRDGQYCDEQYCELWKKLALSAVIRIDRE